jgi:hypothetical protein
LNPDLIYTLIIVGGALLWPIVKLLTQVAYERFKQQLPANQQDMLDRFAQMAVRGVEQGTSNIKGEQKKAMAMDIVKRLLLAAKLPLPNMVILSAAIEAAVLMMDRQQKSYRLYASNISGSLP